MPPETRVAKERSASLSRSNSDIALRDEEQEPPTMPAHVTANLAQFNTRLISIFTPDFSTSSLFARPSLPVLEEHQNAVDSITELLAKPKNCRNVSMVMKMFDDTTADKARTTKGWLITCDLILDKTPFQQIYFRCRRGFRLLKLVVGQKSAQTRSELHLHSNGSSGAWWVLSRRRAWPWG
jgi:hypothetical protein